MTNNRLCGINTRMDNQIDENEEEKIRAAASALGKRGGKVRASIPGEMSRLGKVGGAVRASIPGEMSKLGKAGGAARAAALSPEQRSEIARKAVAAREAKKRAAKETEES